MATQGGSVLRASSKEEVEAKVDAAVAAGDNLAESIVRKLLEDEGDDLKGEMLDAIPTDPISITSSHGEFSVDPRTGRPIERERYDPADPESEFIDQLDRFDLREWLEHYKIHGEAKNGMDILDVGYWMKNGYYEEPAHEWRKQFGPKGEFHHQQPPPTEDDFNRPPPQ